MCELCETDKEATAKYREQHKAVARDLKKLANLYEALADGSVKPHTPGVSGYEPLVKSLLRELVNGW